MSEKNAHVELSVDVSFDLLIDVMRRYVHSRLKRSQPCGTRESRKKKIPENTRTKRRKKKDQFSGIMK